MLKYIVHALLMMSFVVHLQTSIPCSASFNKPLFCGLVCAALHLIAAGLALVIAYKHFCPDQNSFLADFDLLGHCHCIKIIIFYIFMKVSL